MSGDDWDRRTGHPLGACTDCGVKFAAGDVYVARLFVRDGAVVREDRCAKCGEAAAPADALGEWRGKPTAPKGPASRRLDFETLAELFPRLEGRDDDASRRLAWITALLLLRKKLLVQVARETTDGVETVSVKFKHDDRVFRVRDPQLDEAATAQLHEEIGRVFDLEPKARAAK
jgi:hypothetical protein